MPTPEQTYDALAPDLKKQVDDARAARLARENMTAEQLEAQASAPWTAFTCAIGINLPHL